MALIDPQSLIAGDSGDDAPESLRDQAYRLLRDKIVQLDGIRFDNPQFSFDTEFTREDFTDKLVTVLGQDRAVVEGFYDDLRRMNYYDNDPRTTRELFEAYFPGRNDVHRLLMEPITYANGSSLDDPAISYGIVFSNFMSKGVFTATTLACLSLGPLNALLSPRTAFLAFFAMARSMFFSLPIACWI